MNPGRRGDLMILGAIALAQLLLQIWVISGYGYFCDELNGLDVSIARKPSVSLRAAWPTLKTYI